MFTRFKGTMTSANKLVVQNDEHVHQNDYIRQRQHDTLTVVIWEMRLTNFVIWTR
jgi:hypothetical protein